MRFVTDENGEMFFCGITDVTVRQGVKDLIDQITTMDGNLVALDISDVNNVLKVTNKPVVCKGMGETPIEAATRALDELGGALVAECIINIVAGDELMLSDTFNIIQIIREGISGDISDLPFGVIIDPMRKNSVEVTILAAVRCNKAA